MYDLIPELQPCVNNWGSEYLLAAAYTHRRDHTLGKSKKLREMKKGQERREGKRPARNQNADMDESGGEGEGEDDDGDEGAGEDKVMGDG